MDIDEVAGVEEVTTSETTEESGEGNTNLFDPPISVTVGSKPWHNAVPQVTRLYLICHLEASINVHVLNLFFLKLLIRI